eukprot:3624043-Alexandrium_andersonii.AAC.1
MPGLVPPPASELEAEPALLLTTPSCPSRAAAHPFTLELRARPALLLTTPHADALPSSPEL